jgi:polar amino acid transport system substrate-binding protein
MSLMVRKLVILIVLHLSLIALLTCCVNNNETIYLNKNTTPQIPTPVEYSSAPIKLFVHETGFPPFDFPLEEARVTGRYGIYPEIIDEISRRINIPYERVYLPPGRIYEDFRNGVFNVECGCSPLWRTSEKDVSLYTNPYAQDITSIVFRKGDEFPVKSPDDLIGKKLGTVIGYVYPSLNNLFKKGSIEREDASDEKSLMEMLVNNRVDAILITKTVCQYYAKELKYNITIGYTEEDLPIQIRIQNKDKDLVDKFNAAINRMLSDGTISKIYARYK